MGRPTLPAHGTIKRYRLELKTKGVCDKCRAANSLAKARERANRKARDQRAQLSIVPDPQPEPTDEPTPPAPPKTVIPTGHLNLIGGGIENAVRNFLNSTPATDLTVHIYGEIVIAIARVIAVSEPKDIPKLTEEMVDAAKLMAPSTDGGSDDPFAGLGNAT